MRGGTCGTPCACSAAIRRRGDCGAVPRDRDRRQHRGVHGGQRPAVPAPRCRGRSRPSRGHRRRPRRGGFNPSSYPTYLDVRRRATTLEGVYAYAMFPKAYEHGEVGASSAMQRIHGHLVTTNYFTVLGVRPAVGRLFDAGDSERPGASSIVVLSDSFWTRTIRPRSSRSRTDHSAQRTTVRGGRRGAGRISRYRHRRGRRLGAVEHGSRR